LRNNLGLNISILYGSTLHMVLFATSHIEKL
jgi:hypothetical protein